MPYSWLGDRTPSGGRVPRKTRTNFRNQSAPAGQSTDPDAEARALRAAQERRAEQEGIDNFNFRSRPQPELVQRTRTLHHIYNKRNLYAGMGHAWDAWGMVGFNDPLTEPETDNRGNLTFKDSGISLSIDRPIENHQRSPEGRPLDMNVDSSVRESEEGTGSTRRKSRRVREKVENIKFLEEGAGGEHDCGRPGCQGQQDQANGDFMKDLLVGKFHKKRKKKPPLTERIAEFFGRIDVLKSEEERRNIMPTGLEMHRRWVALTRGVRAALAESSDEEADDQLALHTV